MRLPFGWHYLSKATCLTRPHSCYVFSVTSRIAVTRYIIYNIILYHSMLNYIIL